MSLCRYSVHAMGCATPASRTSPLAAKVGVAITMADDTTPVPEGASPTGGQLGVVFPLDGGERCQHQ